MRDPQPGPGYGVHAGPAVVVDGRLAECCIRGAVDEEALKTASVGQPFD